MKTRNHRAWCGFAALALLCGRAVHAQDAGTVPAGSEGYVLTTLSLTMAAGTSASAGYELVGIVGAALAVQPAASPSYGLAGTASAAAGLSGISPLVFGTRAGRGPAAGGGADRLLGFGFGGFGSPVSVLFEGNPAPASVVSSTTIDLSVPPGVNQHGNPLGPVALSVTAASGATGGREGAFEYTPSLSAPATARIGTALCFRLETAPGATWFMNYGGTVPGVSIPVSPYVGALEIVDPFAVWPGQGSTADGHGTYVLELPSDPFLVGQEIAFQAAVLESTAPLFASYSNVVRVRVLGRPGVSSPVRRLSNPVPR